MATLAARDHALDIGYFGTGIGAGVVLMAAAKAPQGAGALVVRGGRPDTALHVLPSRGADNVHCRGYWHRSRNWGEAAYRATGAWKDLIHIAGAGDSFREPGANEAVAQHACGWFSRHPPHNGAYLAALDIVATGRAKRQLPPKT